MPCQHAEYFHTHTQPIKLQPNETLATNTHFSPTHMNLYHFTSSAQRYLHSCYAIQFHFNYMNNSERIIESNSTTAHNSTKQNILAEQMSSLFKEKLGKVEYMRCTQKVRFHLIEQINVPNSFTHKFQLSYCTTNIETLAHVGEG